MKKYIFLLLAVAGLSACNKQLDLPSDGRITMNEVFNDYDRVRGYLNSCYGYCPGPYMDRSSYTDEAQDADDITPNSKYSNWYVGSVTAQTYVNVSMDGSPWGRLYEGIRKCNYFLNNIGASKTIASDAEKASWVAQAHVLRALYYLQLIKRYGAVPLIDQPLLVDHNFSKDKKASFSEVVTFILKDCDTALMVPATRVGFPWGIYDNQYGIMSRAVAYAIQSQAVTYAASPLWTDGTYSWDKAKTITANALAECLANDYKLFDEKPAATIAQNGYALYHFITSNDQRTRDKETILQVAGQMQVWKYAGLPTTPGMDKAGPCPTQEMVDRYEMANGEAPVTGYADAGRLSPIINPASGYNPADPYAGRDPRFYASIYYNNAVRSLDQPNGKKVETFVGGTEGISATNRTFTRTGYYLRKFNNYKSAQNNDADGAIRLFRLAELYLNFAEAAYQSAGPDAPVTVGNFSMSARDAVSAVRARAGMPAFPSGMSKEAFEKKYRNERSVELAFEEHRYFDVRRWKILDQTDKFVTGMRITKSGSTLTYTRFRFTDRATFSERFLLYPIDQSEINKVFESTGENWQNPGWMD
ncbi:RagB/SusD family nutrient uptake outer membrane protein [Chitinophaga arvensicola]|uniref:Starch-binding associating with outer membrane n=1 Tax=Chitinophaga arvensicola TaxID=29529 RepID=A0A1I0S6T1_9BACT|nr:RagB/SusD family nutrient uptake outer membrane protein [Chitinophaga arvensicola]SEW51241.1 Starch-binding associating with outer membrane [Chitinophaga arvensicola]